VLAYTRRTNMAILSALAPPYACLFRKSSLWTCPSSQWEWHASPSLRASEGLDTLVPLTAGLAWCSLGVASSATCAQPVDYREGGFDVPSSLTSTFRESTGAPAQPTTPTYWNALRRSKLPSRTGTGSATCRLLLELPDWSANAPVPAPRSRRDRPSWYAGV
jgi:hypothetical protein